MKVAIICGVFVALFSMARTRPVIMTHHLNDDIVHAEAVEDISKFISKIQICVLKMTPASGFEAVIENQLLDNFQNLLRKVISCLKSTKGRPASDNLKYVEKQLFPESN